MREAARACSGWTSRKPCGVWRSRIQERGGGLCPGIGNRSRRKISWPWPRAAPSFFIGRVCAWLRISGVRSWDAWVRPDWKCGRGGQSLKTLRNMRRRRAVAARFCCPAQSGSFCIRNCVRLWAKPVSDRCWKVCPCAATRKTCWRPGKICWPGAIPRCCSPSIYVAWTRRGGFFIFAKLWACRWLSGLWTIPGICSPACACPGGKRPRCS